MRSTDVYAWAIEYPVHRQTAVVFVLNDGRHDIAYAEQRAADLHGIIVPLIADRRHEDASTTTA
ncbi:MAG: hypothetical protein OEU93_19070 [Rubrivivax sp.]|nr:hypothetical protein [Rubrivivax sp.]